MSTSEFPNSPEEAPLEDEASGYSNLYKFSGRTLQYTQEQHRENFLKRQKDKRSNAFNEKRDLFDLFEETASENEMECEQSPTNRKFKFKPINKRFRNKMMGSEWFVDIPDDLSDNWICKVCPEGLRCLVVAQKGITSCYMRNGRLLFKFKSNLPGGSGKTLGHRFTVLDCISNKKTNTLFVYDVLAWNNLSLVDAEASLRFSWLKSKFEEDPEICTTNNSKKFSFMLIDCFPAQNDIIQAQMFVPFEVNETQIPLEGIIFYHKEGHYVFGKSPLVGWLKPFMLPELLHIDVHPDHLCNKPKNYVSFRQYINSKEQKKHSNRNEEMEMESVEVTNEIVDCDTL